MYATLLLIGCIVQGLVTAFLLERYLIHRRVRAQLVQIPWWRHWLVYFVACLPTALVAVLELHVAGVPLVANVLVAIRSDALATTVAVSQLIARKARKRAAVRSDVQRR